MLKCKKRLRAASQPYQHVCEQCGDGPCTYETLTQRRQREVRAQYAEDAARSMFDRPQVDVDRVRELMERSDATSYYIPVWFPPNWSIDIPKGTTLYPHPDPRLPAYAEALKVAREALIEYERRIQEIIPLFVEARNALPAIKIASAKIHGVSFGLSGRMDAVGTRDWRTPAVHVALTRIDALLATRTETRHD